MRWIIWRLLLSFRYCFLLLHVFETVQKFFTQVGVLSIAQHVPLRSPLWLSDLELLPSFLQDHCPNILAQNLWPLEQKFSVHNGYALSWESTNTLEDTFWDALLKANSRISVTSIHLKTKALPSNTFKSRDDFKIRR